MSDRCITCLYSGVPSYEINVVTMCTSLHLPPVLSSVQVLDEFVEQANFTSVYGNDTAALNEANDQFEMRISYWSLGFGGLAILTFAAGFVQVRPASCTYNLFR